MKNKIDFFIILFLALMICSLPIIGIVANRHFQFNDGEGFAFLISLVFIGIGMVIVIGAIIYKNSKSSKSFALLKAMKMERDYYKNDYEAIVPVLQQKIIKLLEKEETKKA